jgi:hypothetical protein
MRNRHIIGTAGLIIALLLMAPNAFAQGSTDLVTDDPSDFDTCDATCQGQSPPSPPGQSHINKHNIELFLIDEYLARWGLVLAKPAYVFTKNLDFGRGRNVWTSVAYIDNTRYRLYVDKNANVSSRVTSLINNPASIHKTLTVVVDHGNTNIPDLMDTLLVDVQNQINADHWEHAAEVGLADPIVGFDYTNLLVSANEFANPMQDPKIPARVYELLVSKGFVLEDWDLIVVMDLDPANQSGGFAFFGGTWAYIGYFFEQDPGFVTLTENVLTSIARGLYHHDEPPRVFRRARYVSSATTVWGASPPLRDRKTRRVS